MMMGDAGTNPGIFPGGQDEAMPPECNKYGAKSGCASNNYRSEHTMITASKLMYQNSTMIECGKKERVLTTFSAMFSDSSRFYFKNNLGVVSRGYHP